MLDTWKVFSLQWADWISVIIHDDNRSFHFTYSIRPRNISISSCVPGSLHFLCIWTNTYLDTLEMLWTWTACWQRSSATTPTPSTSQVRPRNQLSEISPIIPHGCSINHNQKPILIKMLTSIDITININMEIIHKHFIHSFELYRQYRHWSRWQYELAVHW